ncbi:MAG TPA: DUF3617 domain-containing protein [Sphingomicrobium sp.]|nr:DUF3617 domain-containing protein [Sphingomicrobium sp.]
MKHAAYALASVLCLTACNKGPQVNLRNATGNQVSQAVGQSGVMTSDSMVQPGLWESKVTIQEMNIPGMPAQYADKMKQSIAEHRNESSKHCITAADVKRPKEDFFGADKSCKYDHFTMGAGRIDIAMVCHAEDTTQNMNVSGSYTPTTYSIDTSMSGSGGREGGMSMKMHVDSSRVGECTGKDED